MKKIVLPSCSRKRLISTLLSSRSNMKIVENESFVLKGTTDFTLRSNNTFGELGTLEFAHKTWISENKIQDSFSENKNQDRLSEKKIQDSSSENKKDERSQLKSIVTSTYIGKTGKTHEEATSDSFLFKKPQSTKIYRQRHNPIRKTWKANSKWKKYSLADIPLSSNATNASVALAFITELRENKVLVQEAPNNNEKILYAKPSKTKVRSKSALVTSSKSFFQKEKTSTQVKKADYVKLQHLENE